MNALQGFDMLHSGLVDGLMAVTDALNDAARNRDTARMLQAYNALVRRHNHWVCQYDIAAREHNELLEQSQLLERRVDDLEWEVARLRSAVRSGTR